jgi:hypothetical protein
MHSISMGQRNESPVVKFNLVCSVYYLHTLRVETQQLWWSRGSVLPLSTQVRGFNPGRSRQDFSGRKNSARLPSEGE